MAEIEDRFKFVAFLVGQALSPATGVSTFGSETRLEPIGIWLYQGTALAVPQSRGKTTGFSPWAI
jgi:hypothetical protein